MDWGEGLLRLRTVFQEGLRASVVSSSRSWREECLWAERGERQSLGSTHAICHLTLESRVPFVTLLHILPCFLIRVFRQPQLPGATKEVATNTPISHVGLRDPLWGSWAGNSWGLGSGAGSLSRALSLPVFSPVVHDCFWAPPTVGMIQLSKFCNLVGL